MTTKPMSRKKALEVVEKMALESPSKSRSDVAVRALIEAGVDEHRFAAKLNELLDAKIVKWGTRWDPEVRGMVPVLRESPDYKTQLRVLQLISSVHGFEFATDSGEAGSVPASFIQIINDFRQMSMTRDPYQLAKAHGITLSAGGEIVDGEDA